MSNHYQNSRTDEPETSWNIPHLFKATAMVSGAVALVLAVSHVAEKKEKTRPQNTQPDIVQAFVDKKETFQGLPIIRIGNIEEIHTLKQSGKSGWYVFQEGNTITYLKVRSGITEFNTYTLTQ